MNPTPVRLQRRRTYGYRLNSPNGLPVKCCTRPGKYGNPYRLGSPGATTVEKSVAMYRRAIMDLGEGMVLSDGRQSRDISAEIIRAELSNMNLACYCALCPKHEKTGKPLNEDCPDCKPCHVDVIGEILYPRKAR